MVPKNVLGDDFFPIKFMLRMNNQHIGDVEGWQNVYSLNFDDIELLSGTTHTFMLEWEWPFESGNDSLDTEVGRSWKDVGLTIVLIAKRV